MTDKLKGAPKFSADKSCYVEIGGFTVYIEVSGATDDVPLVNYWAEDYPEDTVTKMIVEQDYGS
tara:strand:+ start:1536 stop:1727 length:192 start_codon:yes stop_codon:yes gene_type:complete